MKVVDALDTVAAKRGYPESITVDNGSEFCSRVMDAWAYRHGVKLDFIRPASRWRTLSRDRNKETSSRAYRSLIMTRLAYNGHATRNLLERSNTRF